jgi:hypothetical protein
LQCIFNAGVDVAVVLPLVVWVDVKLVVADVVGDVVAELVLVDV